MRPADTDTDSLIRQVIGGHPAAAALIVDRARSSDEPSLLVTAALLGPAVELLARATAVAVGTRDRQLVAIAAAHLAGDAERVDALARDHLVDYPDSILVAWIASACPPGEREKS